MNTEPCSHLTLLWGRVYFGAGLIHPHVTPQNPPYVGLSAWVIPSAPSHVPHCLLVSAPRDEEGGDAEGELDSGLVEDVEDASASKGNKLTEEAAIAKGYLPTACVVGILHSGRREYCGVLNVPDGPAAGNQRLLFFPQSKKIPRVRISTRFAVVCPCLSSLRASCSPGTPWDLQKRMFPFGPPSVPPAVPQLIQQLKTNFWIDVQKEFEFVIQTETPI